MSALAVLMVLALGQTATISSSRPFHWTEDGKARSVKEVQVKAFEFVLPKDVNGVFLARLKTDFDLRQNFLSLQSHPVDFVIVFTEGKRQVRLLGAKIKQVIGVMPNHQITAEHRGPTLDVTIEAKQIGKS
jgi:hypothetical protein